MSRKSLISKVTKFPSPDLFLYFFIFMWMMESKPLRPHLESRAELALRPVGLGTSSRLEAAADLAWPKGGASPRWSPVQRLTQFPPASCYLQGESALKTAFWKRISSLSRCEPSLKTYGQTGQPRSFVACWFSCGAGDSKGCATAVEPHPSVSPHQPASNCIQILTGILKGKRDNKHLPQAQVFSMGKGYLSTW